MSIITYFSSLKGIKYWAFATAAVHFIIFLSVFLIVSYLSTLLKIDDSGDSEKNFISKYEKYIVLSSSLYMIIPFTASTLLLYGILHKHQLILKIFTITSAINCCVIVILDLGSGIFLAIKGHDYVAYSLITTAIILDVILCHGILLTLGIKEHFSRAPPEEEDLDEEAN